MKRAWACLHNRPAGNRGGALIEVSLMAPWIFFLFLGVIDLGFYWYAAIATENAARVAAFYLAQSPSALADTAGACTYALEEAKALPGLSSVVGCGALPFKVVVTAVTGPDSTKVGNAVNVAVTYQTPLMIPIPGMLTNRLTLTRQAQMRVNNN